MYIKKTYGCVLTATYDSPQLKGLLDIYIPETHKSAIWKYWRAILDPKLCLDCLSHHGKVYAMDEIPDVEPPLHENCRCAILPMDVITPGGATKDGENGADYWLVHDGELPDYYISKSELEKLVGSAVDPLKNGHLGRWYLAAYIKTRIIIFLLFRGEFGMRQISTTTMGCVMGTESYSLMMACFL